MQKGVCRSNTDPARGACCAHAMTIPENSDRGCPPGAFGICHFPLRLKPAQPPAPTGAHLCTTIPRSNTFAKRS